MRKLTNKPAVKIDGLELPILNTGKDGKIYNCYVEPLQRFKREIDAMLSHHCKIFVLRFDVHVHTHSQTNEVISKFRKSYADRIKRYYKTKNVAYVWCREVEKSKKQHYHFAVIVDGNEAWVAGALLAMAEEVASLQDLTIGFCKNPSYLIKRADLSKGDYSTYNDAFKRLSYLAKERGKAIKAERANSYQTSRIKPRLNENGKVFSHKDDYKQYRKNKSSSQRKAKALIEQVVPKHTPTVVKPVRMMTDAERQLPLF